MCQRSLIATCMHVRLAELYTKCPNLFPAKLVDMQYCLELQKKIPKGNRSAFYAISQKKFCLLVCENIKINIKKMSQNLCVFNPGGTIITVCNCSYNQQI